MFVPLWTAFPITEVCSFVLIKFTACSLSRLPVTQVLKMIGDWLADPIVVPIWNCYCSIDIVFVSLDIYVLFQFKYGVSWLLPFLLGFGSEVNLLFNYLRWLLDTLELSKLLVFLKFMILKEEKGRNESKLFKPEISILLLFIRTIQNT